MTKQWMKIFACIAIVIFANNVVRAAPTGLAAAVDSYLKPAADAAEEKIKDCTGQGSLDSTGECSKVLKTILRDGAIDSLNQQLSLRNIKGLAKGDLLEYAEQFQKGLGLSNAEFINFKAGLKESITGNSPVFLRTMKCNKAGKCKYLLFATGPYTKSKLEILTLKSTMAFSVAPDIVVVQQTVTDPESGLPAGNKIVMKEVPKTKENGVDDVMVYFDKYVYQEMKKAFHNDGGNGGYDGPKPPTQVNPFANLFDENDSDDVTYRSIGEDDFGFAFDSSNGKVQGIQRYSPNKQREQALIDACYSAGLRGSEARQFMAQCSHECDNFNTMEEYASGAAYEGRSDLGNTQPGDGRRYKGRGYIQLTGRANYIDVGRAIGENLVDNPDRAKEPRVAAKVALHFWKTRVRRRVSNFCDTYAVTRVINGGTNGLSDRKSKFAKYGGCDGSSGGGDPDHKCTAARGKCADSNAYDCSTGFRSSLCSGSYSNKCCTGTISKKGSSGGGSSPGGGSSSTTCSSCLKGGGGKGCASRCPSNYACQNCVKFGGGAGCLINSKCGTCAGTCFNKYSGSCSGSVETSKCPGSSSIVCCASGKLNSGSMYDSHHSSDSFTDVGSKVVDLGHKITNLDDADDDFHNRFKAIVNRGFNRCVRKCFVLLHDAQACKSQCRMDGQEIIEESKGIAQYVVSHMMDNDDTQPAGASDDTVGTYADVGHEVDTYADVGHEVDTYSDVGHEVDNEAGSRNLREALNPSSGNWKYDLGDGSSIRNMLVNHQVFDEQKTRELRSSWKENIKKNFVYLSFPFSRAGKCSKIRYEAALKTRSGCCPTRLSQKCQKAIFNKCCAKCNSGSCFRICALEGSSDIERNC